ncbi:helix-turn-helix domain-containing protein [Actinoallomurus sp. NPDC050550]|uniref:helix-turn-helix domain-containing protein n=1 Tax=Actinoallomurus sp. NPDC050550 TaxID=3154937 RepID=UPI0033F95E5F
MKLRRAIVVLMSAQGQGVPDIAHLLDCSPEYVRGVIHDFNDMGFDALNPKWSGGRPKTISEAVRRHIRLIARCCPRDLGLPFSTWSLSKLAEHLVATQSGRLDQPRIDPADPAGRRDHLAGHQDLGGLKRPGLHHQDAPCPGALR